MKKNKKNIEFWRISDKICNKSKKDCELNSVTFCAIIKYMG